MDQETMSSSLTIHR